MSQLLRLAELVVRHGVGVSLDDSGCHREQWLCWTCYANKNTDDHFESDKPPKNFRHKSNCYIPVAEDIVRRMLPVVARELGL